MAITCYMEMKYDLTVNMNCWHEGVTCTCYINRLSVIKKTFVIL